MKSQSPIYYGASVEKKNGVIESFNALPIQEMFNATTLEGEMEEYPLEAIVESLTQLFGNEADAKNLLNTLFALSIELYRNDIDTNILIPIIHVVSVLPYFTEKIKALETTVDNLQYALANK